MCALSSSQLSRQIATSYFVLFSPQCEACALFCTFLREEEVNDPIQAAVWTSPSA